MDYAHVAMLRNQGNLLTAGKGLDEVTAQHMHCLKLWDELGHAFGRKNP